MIAPKCSSSIKQKSMCAPAMAATVASVSGARSIIEFGGPDGGDGGKGGDIIVECVADLNTLTRLPLQAALQGEEGRPRHGPEPAAAPAVPMSCSGSRRNANLRGRWRDTDRRSDPARRPRGAARGGNGGFGNAHFKSSTNQAPRRANPGQPGVESWHLAAAQADRRCRAGRPAQCRQVDLPGGGQRGQAEDRRLSLHHAPSQSRGRRGSTAASFVLADIPGLIEGAHEGAGIGDRFLGHVERCAVLLHLVDATREDPADGLPDRSARELEAYGAGSTEKPEIVALNKVDAARRARRAEAARPWRLQAAGGKAPLVMSRSRAAHGMKPAEVCARCAGAIKAARAVADATDAREAPGWRP